MILHGEIQELVEDVIACHCMSLLSARHLLKVNAELGAHTKIDS